MIEAKAGKTRWQMMVWYGYNLFIAVDQLANAAIGGWSDETLSSCAYRMHRDGKPWGRLLMPVIDVIFFWQDKHCEGAYIKERKRIHFPPELRQ